MIHIFLFDQSALLQSLRALKMFLISPWFRMEAPLAEATFLNSRFHQLPAPTPKTGGSRVLTAGCVLPCEWGVSLPALAHRGAAVSSPCSFPSGSGVPGFHAESPGFFSEPGVRIFWTLAVTIHISGKRLYQEISFPGVTGLDKYLIKK